MVAFIGVIGYGLSVTIDFLQPSKIFFQFLRDSTHLLRTKELSCAVSRHLLLRWPQVLLLLWHCHSLTARCYPCSLSLCKATIYAVRSTVSQCYWQSLGLGKNIEVVKESIYYSRNSTENWKGTPTKLKNKIKKSCKQNFCFLNKSN